MSIYLSSEIIFLCDRISNIKYLRIGSCLACVYRVMDARGKLGEHERSVRVARGVAECKLAACLSLRSLLPVCFQPRNQLFLFRCRWGFPFLLAWLGILRFVVLGFCGFFFFISAQGIAISRAARCCDRLHSRSISVNIRQLFEKSTLLPIVPRLVVVVNSAAISWG